MICPRCHHQDCTLEIVDEATVTIRCVMGHTTTLFKYRHTWETSAQRMKRLERFFTCEACGTVCRTFTDTHEGNERTLCDKCRAREYKSGYVLKGARKNLGSPWRLHQQHEKKEAKHEDF